MTEQQTTPAPPPAAPAYDAAPPAPPKRTFRDRVRGVPRAGWLSAAAVVVIVGVGLGGFFIGRATAPDDGRFPNGGPGQRPDFGGGQGPGNGRMPGNGQLPGLPGQQGQAPDAGSDSGTDGSTDGSTDGGAEDSADTTSWYVVPSAA